ncbi:MAG: hypothetical protein JSV82_09965 [Planctomycetota bacterium]|nr:MAG: hypothetical protein JSV82_09965 [Planctomycetota bacterium]
MIKQKPAKSKTNATEEAIAICEVLLAAQINCQGANVDCFMLTRPKKA